MTRKLVLTSEGAGHPFRRTLSPDVLAIRPRRSDDHDWKLFCLSFAAFFVCFATLIL